MDFIIGKVVLFSSENCYLQNIETGDVIKLPKSASLILQFLIENKTIPIERETFLDRAWNDFGVNISNNTLNQYISLIRKNILELGIDEQVIITIPKIGFCMAEVYIHEIESHHKDKMGKSYSKFKYFYAFSVIMFVLEFFYISNFGSPGETYKPVKIGNIGICDLYSSSNISDAYSQAAIKKANSMANKYLPCRNSSIFIFDADGDSFLQRGGRTFLARCERSSKPGEFVACAEVLIHEKN